MEENEEVKNEEVMENQGEVTLENTNIKIADDVIAVIAGAAASEAGGFAGGISEVFSGKKNFAKGIKVETGDKETKIDVNIIVEYGVRIPDVAYEIQTRVKKAVEGMTGLKVSEVNVHIQGVKTQQENVQDENSED